MFLELGGQKDGNFPGGYGAALQGFFQSEVKPPNEMIFDDVFNSIMFPLQRKRELRKMLQAAAAINPRVVGEIGCDKGGSLYHWANSIPGVERVYGCEFRGIPFKDEFTKAMPDKDFLFVHGSSYDDKTIEAVTEWLDGDKFDCLFLDGDKLHFFDDYVAYSKLVRQGGIMFLHDINGEPPEAAFNKIALMEVTHAIIDTTEAENLEDFHPENAWESWLKYWGTRSCGVGVVYI
jgi:predicted O-methyltransferase YrrM